MQTSNCILLLFPSFNKPISALLVFRGSSAPSLFSAIGCGAGRVEEIQHSLAPLRQAGMAGFCPLCECTPGSGERQSPSRSHTLAIKQRCVQTIVQGMATAIPLSPLRHVAAINSTSGRHDRATPRRRGCCLCNHKIVEWEMVQSKAWHEPHESCGKPLMCLNELSSHCWNR